MQTDQNPEKTLDFTSPEKFQSNYENLTKDLFEAQNNLYLLSCKIAERINVVHQSIVDISKQVTQQFEDNGKLKVKKNDFYFLDYSNQKQPLTTGYGHRGVSNPIMLHHDDADSFMCYDNHYILDLEQKYHDDVLVYRIEYPINIDYENNGLMTEVVHVPAYWLCASDNSLEEEYRLALTKAMNDRVENIEQTKILKKENEKANKLELFNKPKTELGL